jgi:hypothetical protein
MPAQQKVLCNVPDDRSLEPESGVVPAEAVTAWVLARVESVTSESRQVDPAHERRLVVDDDQLLVVAVERPLACVERHRDPRAADEVLAGLPHLASVRMEERQRRAGPGKNAHLDPLGRVREQFPQRRSTVLEPEGRVEVPAGEVDVRARRANRVCDPRQRLASVYERLDTASGARRERRGARPAVGHRVDRLPAPLPPKAPHVVAVDDALDRLAHEIVEAVQRIGRHGGRMPRSAGNLTPPA